MSNTKDIENTIKKSYLRVEMSDRKDLIDPYSVKTFDELDQFAYQQRGILDDYVRDEDEKFDMFYETNPTKELMKWYLYYQRHYLYKLKNSQYNDMRTARSCVQRHTPTPTVSKEDMVEFVKKQQEDMNRFLTE